MINWLKRYKWWLLAASATFALLLWGPTAYAKLSTDSRRYDLSKTAAKDIPKHHVAIVFGAGLLANDQPTPYLKWRVETAVELYKTHRVDKLLMTGDNTEDRYNEPLAMRRLAVKLGVPTKNIALDYAGLNTYDSCYRAQAVFKVKSAIVVTQGYHLPRAVMACSNLGIDTVGVAARHSGRDFTVSYIMREWLSTDKITAQLIFKPNPTALGRPLPID